MNYKKLTHKEYLNLIQNRNKSLMIATYQDKENLQKIINIIFEEEIYKKFDEEGIGEFLNILSLAYTFFPNQPKRRK